MQPRCVAVCGVLPGEIRVARADDHSLIGRDRDLHPRFDSPLVEVLAAVAVVLPTHDVAVEVVRQNVVLAEAALAADNPVVHSLSVFSHNNTSSPTAFRRTEFVSGRGPDPIDLVTIL